MSRSPRLPGLVALCLALLPSASALAAPRITISSPQPGWTAQRTVRIRGKVVFEASAPDVTLVFDGIPQALALVDGVFEVDHLLAPGANEARIVAVDPSGTTVASVWVHASVPASAFKAILTWDARDADVDLSVTDPHGECCDFNHAATALGGRLDLDVSDGYGPETFTLPASTAGRIRVQLRLFAAPDDRPVRCRIDVILHEGSEREEHRIYRATLARQGETTTVAEIEMAGDR